MERKIPRLPNEMREALSKLVKDCGYTARDFADEAGIPQTVFYEILGGTRGLSEERARTIYELLGKDKSVSFLVGEGYEILKEGYQSSESDRESTDLWENLYLQVERKIHKAYEGTSTPEKGEILEGLERLAEGLEE